jgi:hypothetical protein
MRRAPYSIAIITGGIIAVIVCACVIASLVGKLLRRRLDGQSRPVCGDKDCPRVGIHSAHCPVGHRGPEGPPSFPARIADKVE